MSNFALIGAAGYIAPRHMKAITAIGSNVVAAYDPNDSVGILDSHFPDAHFFTEFEQFDRHLDLARTQGEKVDYFSICSPNYLHDAHMRYALRSGADAICEKPLVLDPAEIDRLVDLERRTGHKVWTILQLRLHPAIRALRERVAATNRRYSLDLTYIATRGRWYHTSWKGDVAKSGGVATNIGVHFFDMLSYVFGAVEKSEAHLREDARAGGYLALERADVRWFVSVDARDLPPEVVGKKTTYRSITMDGEEIEFSEGFTDLHTRSYEEILAGRGYSPEEVRACIGVVSGIRNMPLSRRGEIHPYSLKYMAT